MFFHTHIESQMSVQNPGALACFFTQKLKRQSKTQGQPYVFSHTSELIGGQLLKIRALNYLPQVIHNKNLNDDFSGSSFCRIDPFSNAKKRQPIKLLRPSAKGAESPTVALL
jgi:hypothetical protein